MSNKHNGNGHDHPAVQWAELAPGYRRPYILNDDGERRFFFDGWATTENWRASLADVRRDGWTLPGDIEAILQRHAKRIEPPPGYLENAIAEGEAQQKQKPKPKHKRTVLIDAPFDNDLARATWDRFASKHPELVEYLKGTAAHNELLPYATFVEQVHDVAMREALAIVPDMVVGWIRHFAGGPYHDLPDLAGFTQREWTKATQASIEAALKAAQPLNVRRELSARSLLKRDISAPERIAGDLVTSTARVFFVGPTGAGKTMVGLALAVGAASGQGFLHWRSSCLPCVGLALHRRRDADRPADRACTRRGAPGASGTRRT